MITAVPVRWFSLVKSGSVSVYWLQNDRGMSLWSYLPPNVARDPLLLEKVRGDIKYVHTKIQGMQTLYCEYTGVD